MSSDLLVRDQLSEHNMGAHHAFMAINPYPGLLHDLKNMKQARIYLEELAQLKHHRTERFLVDAGMEIEKAPAREVRPGQGADGWASWS